MSASSFAEFDAEVAEDSNADEICPGEAKTGLVMVLVVEVEDEDAILLKEGHCIIR